jgi:hypothetical protein
MVNNTLSHTITSFPRKRESMFLSLPDTDWILAFAGMIKTTAVSFVRLNHKP